MSINPEQRRTVIIRGRGQTEMDTLLPIFGTLVERNTPTNSEEFDEKMIAGISQIFPTQTRKTHRNYLTEIIGQLFSMYYEENGVVKIAPLTLKLLNDNDQPAFFKALVSKLQFPNPSAKKHKYDEEVEDGLGVRPLVLVLEVLRCAERHQERLTFDELAYFVLNSREALKGGISAESIYRDIFRLRAIRGTTPDFVGSNARQHIKEALNLLILANLIRTDSHEYWINALENSTIEYICRASSGAHLFRIRNATESHEEFQQFWKKYLTEISGEEASNFETSISALGTLSPERLVDTRQGKKPADIGREGELLVLEIEDKALEAAFPGKGLKAIDYTAKRGIGFDIESIFHSELRNNGSPHYIEVKSTIRVTKPDLVNSDTPDGFTLTRSERQAMDAYRHLFSIYRVYIYSGGSVVHILRNPSELSEKKLIHLVPETWSAVYLPSVVAESCKLLEVSV